MKLAIFGAGSLGKEILSLIQKKGTTTEWADILFIDDVCKDKVVCGIPKYTYDEFKTLGFSHQDIEIVIASGEPKFRRSLFEKIKKDGYQLGTVCATTCYIGICSHIGDGSIIFPNVYISDSVAIGENCIIHANSKIESECVIGEHSFMSLGAFVGANSKLGKSVFIGPNAALFDHIEVGENSIVGIGSVVTQNVMVNTVVAGNPAKKLRDNSEGRVFKKQNCLVGN